MNSSDTWRGIVLAAVMAAIAVCSAGQAAAAEKTWNGVSDGTYSTDGNWLGGTTPADDLTTDVAVFGAKGVVLDPNLTANRSVNGLKFTGTGWNFGGAGNLYVGSGGISNSGTANMLSVARLYVTNTFGVVNVVSGTLTISGLPYNAAGSAGDIVKQGAGTLALSGSGASWSGFLRVDAGTVEMRNDTIISTAPAGGGLTGGAMQFLTLTPSVYTLRDPAGAATFGAIDLGGVDRTASYLRLTSNGATIPSTTNTSVFIGRGHLVKTGTTDNYLAGNGNRFGCVLHNGIGGRLILSGAGNAATRLLCQQYSGTIAIGAAGSVKSVMAVDVANGGVLELNAAGNLPANTPVRLNAGPGMFAALRVNDDFAFPTLAVSAGGDGMAVIDLNGKTYSQALPSLGDCYLGNGSSTGATFSGPSLAPGNGSVYRLGGGPSTSVRSITISGSNKLTGDNGVVIGRNGSPLTGIAPSYAGSVYLSGANDYTGLTTVNCGSTLVAYQQASGSPLGSSSTNVLLNGGTLSIEGTTAGPITKGDLRHTGLSGIGRTGGGNGNITFGTMTRGGTEMGSERAILLFGTVSGGLGTSLKVFLTDATERAVVNGMVKPYMLNPAYNFLTYGANGFVDATLTSRSGSFVPADNEVASVASGSTITGDCYPYALRIGSGTSVTIASGVTVHLGGTGGGVTGYAALTSASGAGSAAVTGADSGSALDFGTNEGIICAQENFNLKAKLTGSNGLTVVAPKGSNYSGFKYYTTSQGGYTNTLSGKITLVNSALIPGSHEAGTNLDLYWPNISEIVLSGGQLGNQPQIKTAKTITVGPDGGIIAQSMGGGGIDVRLSGLIQGPGLLTLRAEGNNFYFDPTVPNTYSGGTYVENAVLNAGTASSVGTGPVTLYGSTLNVVDAGSIATNALYLTTSTSTANFRPASSATFDVGPIYGPGSIVLGPSAGSGITTALRVTVPSNETAVFSGAISDQGAGRVGALTKTGAGTLVLAGVNAYSGPTVVSNGTLRVEGILGAGPVTVAAGGGIGGGGYLGGNLALQDEAYFDCPLDSATNGVLYVNGNLALGSHMTLRLSDAGVGKSPRDRDCGLIRYAGSGPVALGSWTIDYGSTGWRAGGIVKLDSTAKLLYVRFPANVGTVVLIR